ncbi:MAG TPA: SPOR domain-containing protein [Thermomonas sp.]|nr:SPOR domain-containing protein [Thermomonas sp.]
MLLRAAIVFLLVLNLGVAAWWLAGGAARPVLAPPAAVPGVPGLRLAGEAPPPAVPAAPAAEAAPASPVPAPAVAVAAAAEPPEPSPASAPADVCLRYGPFADAAARDALRPALAAALRLVPREAPARPARGWRVYLPPLPTPADAQAMAARMRAAGISDLYVMGAGEEPNSIALGRYGSEDAARRREADLRARGFAARAAPLGAGEPRWWLDVRLPAGADRAALAALGPSAPLDCDRLR